MKSGIMKFVVFIAIGSMAACNFSMADDVGRVVDDAAPVMDDVIENAAPVVDDVVQDAAPVVDDAARIVAIRAQSLSDDISRIVLNESITVNVESSFLLSPEEQEELHRLIKSATCLYLNAHIEGRTPREEEVLKFVTTEIVGLRLYTVQQKIASKAKTAFERISIIAEEKDFYGAIYIAGVTLYCEAL